MHLIRPLGMALLLIALGACQDDPAGHDGNDAGLPDAAAPDAALPDAAAPDAEAVPDPLVTDLCDEDPMNGVDFALYTSGAFRIFYLPGTAAASALEDIAQVRQAALAEITTALDVTEDRTLELDLAPSRLAADAHNIGAGLTYPDLGVIQALYLDNPVSYERVAYGHELTHAVSYHLDDVNPYHLKLLDEGLAERFDQSGRDLHQVFVQECRAYGTEVDAAVILDDYDALGYSYAKAGSFVTHLFSLEPDPALFRALYQTLYVTWTGNTPHAPDGDVLDGPKLEAILDAALQSVYGMTLADFRTGWLAALTPYLATEPLRVPAGDEADLADLLAVRARAMTLGDVAAYRSTMEGFYCDVIPESHRVTVATTLVTPATPTTASVVEIFDLGLKNYRTAWVVFDSTRDGATQRLWGLAERYPVGWRFLYVQDEL